MSEQTSASIVISAPAASVLAVIADFAAYPEWAKGVSVADVVAVYDDDQPAEVFFSLDVTPIKDQYTLAYDWDEPGRVSWSLVEGQMLKGLVGSYTLASLADGSTEVTYELTLELAIPVIGLLKRKGEKILIDTALKGLKSRVESLAHG
jgi:ribosome-associated toxin RatA of RatAB toxin-antitoxin module